MKFSLLLFALGLKLRFTAFMDKSFRKGLRRKDFTLTIRTADGRRARTFLFRKGWVLSRIGRRPAPDTELVWEDPDRAFKIMLSKNDLDGFSAIGRGELRIKGNMENALKFMDIAG